MNERSHINTKTVTLYSEIINSEITALLARFGLTIDRISINIDSIPGSYWGESEAGLIKNTLFVRDDTPVHSLLHEACHFICMDNKRRDSLDTDAGGDYNEENAVCYLQVLLSDHLSEFNRNIMFNDMDSWGYTFRLGSAKRWFEEDAKDARDWLIDKKIIMSNEQLSF